MFGLFKKKEKSKVDILNEKYRKLLDESYRLSHTNRKESDLKRAEAEEVLKELEGLDS
jgi:hypothetical protein